jgi:hypothetical protein
MVKQYFACFSGRGDGFWPCKAAECLHRDVEKYVTISYLYG